MSRAHVSDPIRRHPLVAAVAGLNALSAGVGAVGLATGWLDLDPAATARLPWGSPVFGGAALATIVALPNAVLAVAALRRDPGCGRLSIGVGVVLVGWIVVELAVIREVSFFHPLYAAIGVLQVWLGARVVHDSSRATRPSLLR